MSALSVLAVVDSFGNNQASVDPAASATGVLVSLVVGLVFYLFFGYIFSRVFKKAGRPGWAGFVPLYNTWVLFEISGKPGWWALLFIPSFIPFIGLLFSLALLVLTLLAALELAKRFGKGQLFAIFGLWLFSFIGYIILAFDSSRYNAAGAPPASPQAPTAPNSTSENNSPPPIVS